MAATSSTTYSSTIQTKWKKELLKVAQGYLLADKWANTDVMGRGSGNTVRINRILRPSKTTTASTAGTLIAPASASALTSNYIDLTMEIWGHSYGLNEDVDIQSFVSNAKNREVIANEMARSLDYQVMKKLATQGLRWRIDNDSTYQVSGTVDEATSTTLVDDARTEIDNHWNGGRITIINPEGPGYDQTSAVTDFTASSDTVECAFTNLPTTASKYHMTVGTDIAATDVLTTTGLLYVMAIHEKLETVPFKNHTFRAFIDAAQHRDLWSDTTFANTAIYDASERWGRYRLVRWLDTEFFVSSEMYREDVDGTENQSTGVVYVTPIFGADSYTVIRYGNPGGQGKFGVAFYPVETPDSQNLQLSAKFLSWKGTFAAGVTRATSVIDLMTGATDLGLTL